MIIEKKQIFLIKKVKKYIKNLNLTGIDADLSSVSFFTTFGTTIGKIYLEHWLGKKKFYNIILFYLKNVLSIASIYNFDFINFKNQNFKNLIITWGGLKDFNKNIFQDHFLNYNSNNIKDYLIIVIYLDVILPKNIPENVIIYKKRNETKSYFFLIKVLFYFMFKNFFSIKKLYYYLSYNNIYASHLYKKLKKIINKNKIQNFIMPYEGQFFQNFLFYKIKKKYFSKTIGIAHAMLPALPINFLCRKKGSPDKLLLSGIEQKNLLIKYLNWNKNKIHLIKSLRIKKTYKKKMKNQLFLPINFHSIKYIKEKFFKYYLKYSNKNQIYVRNHPRAQSSAKHLKLINYIQKFLGKKRNSNKYNSDFIFIGATSAFIEYLENQKKVVHITEFPELECYTNLLWSCIKFIEIDEGIFSYINLKQGHLLKLSERNYNLLKLKNLINLKN